MSEEKKVLKDDEIDLLELAKLIWSRKWFIAKVTGFFIVLGLVIAFTNPKEYETYSTLIPEAIGYEGKIGSSIGGLASLAGVDLGGLTGSAGNTINPGLYRSVAQSTPFLLDLLDEKYFFGEFGEEISVYDFYINYYEVGLSNWIFSMPGRLITLVKPKPDVIEISDLNGNLIRLTKEQQGIMDNLKERILVTMDWELNVVTVEVEMQDPVVAAQVAEFTQSYITNYVTQYSVSKSREQLKFINVQYLEQKEKFEMTQLALATFRDRNKNVNTARAKSEEERLQSEYNLAFNVYNQLAQQRETIKLQLNENTPVFTVLEPVKVPVDKSKPRRGLILFVFFTTGIVLTSGYIVVKEVILK